MPGCAGSGSPSSTPVSGGGQPWRASCPSHRRAARPRAVSSCSRGQRDEQQRVWHEGERQDAARGQGPEHRHVNNPEEDAHQVAPSDGEEAGDEDRPDRGWRHEVLEREGRAAVAREEEVGQSADEDQGDATGEGRADDDRAPRTQVFADVRAAVRAAEGAGQALEHGAARRRRCRWARRPIGRPGSVGDLVVVLDLEVVGRLDGAVGETRTTAGLGSGGLLRAGHDSPQRAGSRIVRDHRASEPRGEPRVSRW